ncbi:MAG: nicotinate (nicotinamide) nucleotide adenylyltransferase [Clostridia bacterium]|nr:nicotinate (nicotinamide) nucleotide adenylyltransferase [Clostridia bacterium]
MDKTRKIGIYGGTFAPPHNGHVYAALAFYERFELDALYIVPSFIPPHKQIDSNDDPAVRLEMAKLAFSSHPDYGKRIFVSDIELVRRGKSYTADTLAYFKEKMEGELYFLCGTDMILTMDTWYNPAYIFATATVVYARREEDRALDGEIDEKIKEYQRNYGGKVVPLNIKAYPLSSTEIRRRRQMGEAVDQWVPASVWRFIQEHGMYTQD